MESTINELRDIIARFSKKIADIPDSEFSEKKNPLKWSKKEVLGHLIDSGHNNLRRFICAQYESTPPKITYDQDYWVKANDYQQQASMDIIVLWTLINQQIIAILETMPAAHYGRSADTGKDSPNLHTLEWLAVDYVRHLKHHLNQIIPQSFDVVYK